ncbi:Glycosyltransferase involved in cell wall bisynthesis [Cetobacterium ceti]|uniref:Glycosyltransferase involved in cell wall bisynthesis n=1 Tax=Cetobacterium ceti TaxID=180163 RepID=A0A1T4LW75_9FUSO|nr:glycosyltransferase [Cetobacterium ceti]SJZ58935.1 Glycosyltransferase involved in cell wall bisynthesis [Cetobacterium ceti]
MKKKIYLLVPCLSGGGAEKIILMLLNGLNRDMFDVKLILQREEGEFLNRILNKKDLIVLNSTGKLDMLLKIRRLLKVNKPDILLSTISRLNLLLATIIPILPKKITYIAREANIISLLENSKKDIILRKLFFNNFDKVIAQSQDMKEDILQNTNLDKNKIYIINNPVENFKVKKRVTEKKDVKKLIAIGRLEYQKGFDLLIKAMIQLKDKNVHLNIVGKGSEEEKLKQLVKKLNLENKISFLGFKDNIQEYLEDSDFFVLSSRFEGFPNVVLEAHMCGKPVVAFKCKGGLNELIIEGINGELALDGDPEDLGKKIKFSLNKNYDSELIKKITEEKYSKDKILKEYQQVLLKCK